jgi:hypothetical protein
MFWRNIIASIFSVCYVLHTSFLLGSQFSPQDEGRLAYASQVNLLRKHRNCMKLLEARIRIFIELNNVKRASIYNLKM